MSYCCLQVNIFTWWLFILTFLTLNSHSWFPWRTSYPQQESPPMRPTMRPQSIDRSTTFQQCVFFWRVVVLLLMGTGHPNWHVGTADASVSSPSFTLQPWLFGAFYSLMKLKLQFGFGCFQSWFFFGELREKLVKSPGTFWGWRRWRCHQASCWGLPPSWHSGLGSQGSGSDPWGQRRRVAARAEAGANWLQGPGGVPGGWRELRSDELLLSIFSMNPYGEPIGARNWLSFDGDFWSKHGLLLMFYIFFMVDNIPRWCNPPDIWVIEVGGFAARSWLAKWSGGRGWGPSHAQHAVLLQFKLHRGCKHWVYCMICMYIIQAISNMWFMVCEFQFSYPDLGWCPCTLGIP